MIMIDPKKGVRGFLIAAWGLSLCLLCAAQDAASILDKADGYRNLAECFALEIRMLDYKSDRLREEMRMAGYFSGDDKSVLVVSSGKNKGMKILMKGDDMWVNLTGSKRGLRITPMQRLMGQAANGDVAKTAFSRDYDAIVLRRDASTIVLELKAKSPGATYQRVLLYVKAGNFRPEKAEFFLLSGKHFKTAHYQEFARFGDHLGISRVKIVDQLNPALFTVIAIGDCPKAPGTSSAPTSITIFKKSPILSGLRTSGPTSRSFKRAASG